MRINNGRIASACCPKNVLSFLAISSKDLIKLPSSKCPNALSGKGVPPDSFAEEAKKSVSSSSMALFKRSNLPASSVNSMSFSTALSASLIDVFFSLLFLWSSTALCIAASARSFAASATSKSFCASLIPAELGKSAVALSSASFNLSIAFL